VYVGRTHWGRKVYFNLKGDTPHVAVAGATGNGKSAFLKLLLYVLCNQQPSSNLEVHIIDLKGDATFAAFRRLPHVANIYRSTEEALMALTWVEQEMWRRISEVEDARYHFRKLPRYKELVLLIDEGGTQSGGCYRYKGAQGKVHAGAVYECAIHHHPYGS
jgi:DNA segregation ATPase FtsK/SpoIIIE-like protein